MGALVCDVTIPGGNGGTPATKPGNGAAYGG